MYLKYALLVCVLLNISVVQSANIGSGFGYPEASVEDKSKQNALNKKPIDLPSKCKIGELLYPGDQFDDWVCDCKPGHIYYPAYDRCFAAYTRGPCASGQLIILPRGAIIPQCIVNPCPKENEVWFRGGCYRLNSAGPCHLPQLNNVVSVNSTTLDLDCIGDMNVVPIWPSNLDDRGTFEDTPNITTTSPPPSPRPDPEVWLFDDCFIGGKRSYQGKCKEIA